MRVRTLAMGEPYPPRPKDEHPSLRGGSFYPGDRGRLTKEGMLILEGRASEIINTGGVKRAPELIEELVLRHPNVAEAAAFGAVGADGNRGSQSCRGDARGDRREGADQLVRRARPGSGARLRRRWIRCRERRWARFAATR